MPFSDRGEDPEADPSLWVLVEAQLYLHSRADGVALGVSSV